MTTPSPALIDKVRNAWSPITRMLDSLQPLAALLARLYVAQVFFLSGLTKLRDWGTTVALFTDEYKVPFLSPLTRCFKSASIWCNCKAVMIKNLPTSLNFGLTLTAPK